MSFFFPPDFRTLATRYAILALLNMVWTLFAWSGQFGDALLAVLPSGIVFEFSILSWATGAMIAGEAGVSFLGRFIIGWMMVLMLLGGLRLLVLRFKPQLLANIPIIGLPDTNGGPLDGRRLRKPWWSLPLLMVLLTFFTVSILIGVVGGAFNRMPPPEALHYAGAWPLWVSLGLSAMGLLWGHRFNSSSLKDVSSFFGAKFVPDGHRLVERVHRLADQLELPRPRVGLVNEVNAFAVGSRADDAAVILGVPLVRNLTTEELDAVIGHELGHIISNDMRQMNLAVGYQRMFGDLFSIFAMFATTAIAAVLKSSSSKALTNSLGKLFNQVGGIMLNVGGELATKGLSRRREFFADAVGAGLTSPAAMASALSKLENIATNRSAAEDRYAYLMFKGGQSSQFAPFATHPPMEARRLALEQGTYTRMMPRKGGA